MNMAARLKDLRQKLRQSSPSNSPTRSDNATLYSDNVHSKHVPPLLQIEEQEVVMVSDSNEDKNEVIELSESEEDVTTTIMKFNKSQQSPKVKVKPRKALRSSIATSDSDDDIKIIPTKATKSSNPASKSSKTVNNVTSRPPKKSKKKLKDRRRKNESDIEDGAISSSSEDEVTRPKLKKTQNGNHKTVRTSDDADHKSPEGSGVENVGEADNYAQSDSFGEYEGDEADLVRSGLKQFVFFSDQDCQILEQMIDDEVVAKIDTFKNCTVDRAPLRNKYFFGEGYTYGDQMRRKGPGMEELYPKGFVDEIPEWVTQFVIKPLEKANIIPKDFVNSCVINDYLAGGCITSHIDPKQLFDRPIYTISLMSDSALSFGVRFSFKPIRCSRPVYRVPLKRGCITAIR